MKKITLLLFAAVLGAPTLRAQTIRIDASAAGRRQVIDGFGTCLAGESGEQPWMQNIYYDDAYCSILRMDLVPRYKAPYSDFTYNSPWFHNSPALPGPDNNNVRTYTNAADYTRLFAGRRATIAVMGENIDQNIAVFDYENVLPRAAGVMAQLGEAKKAQLGDFKLIGSIWSPAPWLKVSSGNLYTGGGGILPTDGTPYPFIWTENFVGGRLDVSNTPRAEFNNTSALTQFARTTAAYVRGFQNRNNVRFYALSIQNELNFETFYNSCTYPLTSQYIAALKAVRTEFNKYPDLAGIKLIGPEDLLGGSAYGMWQYGAGESTVHKNLQYLTELAKDPAAQAAVDFYCLHGYAADGVSSGGASPTLWDWWANGWTDSPAGGIPANVQGFRRYNKKSWMTETSGEQPAWLFPETGFPSDGGFSVALKIHQALTTGYQSGWVYWQLADGSDVSESTLTDEARGANSDKYTAFKHFARYIRPNAVRLESTVAGSSTVNASSYLHEANRSLTVVLVNASSTAQTVTVTVPTLPFTLSSFQAYTSSNGSLWRNSTLPLARGEVAVSLPAYGVVTLYGGGTTLAAKRDQSRSGIEVYPNPTKGELNVSLPEAKAGEVSIVLTNTLNARVLSETRQLGSNKQLMLSVNKLPAGWYFMTITQGDQRFVKSVMVTR
ncbi:T9SS type A sorting domain-containing protein [Hymenobacter sp. BT664]|uniref:T9SS type A sorting domain-containing protein n=1 Tax=Hymenobacter montanus TaxID=2771359 RepID=A0A927GHF6_9BACT|nr:T9SS type A sorting domain-containing protein [Hymenobacter montanus]MBD2766272.1 T9SS type A sorting domain-containing protein [Hymenobacter montanus]